MTSATSFFDILSVDELSIVARYLSDTPRSDLWLSTVRRAARKLLLLRSSPFVCAVPLLLKAVRINCVGEYVASMNFFADDPLLVDVIENYGAHIRHLRIVEHERVIRKLTESMYNRLIANCTGITRISFWFRGYSIKKHHHKRLLLAVQDNLRELELQYEVPFSADMVQRFSGCEFPVLERLVIDGPQVDGILPTLLSKQLVCVEIQSWFSTWEPISAALQAVCPELTAVLLKGMPENLHVPLLTSFGKQLLRANLQWISIEGSTQVIKECPNVASELHIDWTYVPRLQKLAGHVSRLALDPLEINPMHDMEMLKDISKRCAANLQGISCISGIADTRVLKALFQAQYKKEALTYMRVAMRRAVLDAGAFVYTTGNLREVDLLVAKFTDINTLTKFVTANPKLHTVKITQAKKIYEKQAHAAALKILTATRMHLPCIKSIRIHLPVLVDPNLPNYKNERVSNACSFFRLRQVVVQVTPAKIFS